MDKQIKQFKKRVAERSELLKDLNLKFEVKIIAAEWTLEILLKSKSKQLKLLFDLDIIHDFPIDKANTITETMVTEFMENLLGNNKHKL